jgi:2-polyprenyl-3-methyl-5-hydroxy-6-metoxy-1,4-benzoquinol methylase
VLEQKYRDKEDAYYGNCRKEILPFLPKRASRVLEVGCGSGDTLAFLKASGYCDYTIGVELFPEAADIAVERVDKLYRSNIEAMDLTVEPGSVDVILCLDVLEHLVNPHQAIRYLHTLLSPGGCIIASIPNIRHFTASLPLLLKNEWEYKDQGILDNTHLRFFVRDTAIQLMQCSGLQLDHVMPLNMGRKGGLLNKASLGLCESFFALQYLIKVTKSV